MKKVAFVLMCVCLAVSTLSFADETIVYENDYEGETPDTAFDEGSPWSWLDNLDGPHTCTYQDDGTGNIVVHHNGHIDNSGGAEAVDTRFGTQWGLTMSGNTSPNPADYIIEFDINSVSGDWDPIAIEFFVLTNGQGYGSGASDYNQADGWVHVEYNLADLNVPWWNGTNWDLTSSTWRIEVGGPPWPGTSVPAGTPAWDQVWVMDNLKITQISDPTKSYDPAPQNGATSVNVDPILSWTPGVYAELHDIYLGTDFNDVNDANRGNPMDVLEKQGHDSNSYGPLALEYETTYYWRIDDVNDPNIYKGSVWSFTTSKEYLAEIIVYENDYEDQTPGNTFTEGDAWNWGTDYCAHTARYQDYSGNIVVEHLGAINNTTAEAQDCRFGSKWDIAVSGNTSSDPNDYTISFDLRSVSGNWDPIAIEFYVLTKEASDQGYGSGASAYNQADGWVHVVKNLSELTAGWWEGTNWDLTNSAWSIEVGGPPYPGTSVPAGQAWYQIWVMDNLKITELVGAKSYNPDPPNGATGVKVDPILSWTPGVNADKHDIYLGTDETAVTDANLTVTLGVLEKQGHDSNSYGPLALEYETTYYWRVDEVNGLNIWKGNVWSFTTEPNIPITDPNLLCWLTFDEGEGSMALDQSGHSNHGTIVGDASWGSGMLQGALEFDGTDDYVVLPIGEEISSMNDCTIATWVDFSNEGGAWQRIFDFGNDTDVYMFLTPRMAADGVMRFAITLTSTGGEELVDAPDTLASGWHHVALIIDADDNTLTLYLDGSVVGETPGVILRPSDLGVTTNNWLGRSQWPPDAYFMGSLDDFRIYNKVLTEEELRPLISPPWAWRPSPSDNATISVAPKPILTWMPGRYADKHDVYFGTDETAVTDANRTNPLDVLVSQNQDPCSYDPCAVDFGQTYYWRIDEVNMTEDPNIWKGYVWSFTTAADYIEIDNFDRYSTLDDLNDVWKDGYVEMDTGSHITVSTAIDPRYGHESPGPIHEGTNALQFVYDNDAFACRYVPGEWEECGWRDYYYSEIEATTDALGVSDWTTEGVRSLSLSFYGDPCNSVIGDVNQMYIAIEDGDEDVAIVKYGSDATYENMNDLKKPIWQQWNIDLQRFVNNNASIDLNDVNKVYIGFGVRGNSDTAGGYGIVYFDSIRLYLPRCVPERVAAGDLSGDCDFNLDDFVIMAEGWRCEAEEAPDSNLVGQWKFDEASGTTATDSIGGNHGTILGGAVLDGSGQLLLDGTDDYVDLPIGSLISTLDECSFAAWMDWDGGGGYQRIFDFGYPNEPNLADLNEVTTPDVYMYASTSWFRYAITIGGFEQVAQGTPSPMPSGQHFVVVTVDINDADPNYTTLSLYLDGRVAGYNADANLEPSDLDNTPNNWLGRSLYTVDAYYSGSYDEFRIYNRVLSEVEVAELYCSTLARPRADLNGDGVVDFKDMVMIIDKWLKETLWP